MSYTIGIAVHNQPEMTAKCLESMIRYAGDEKITIMVFDNASNPPINIEPQAKLIGDNPNIILRLMRSTLNLGFGDAQTKIVNTLLQEHDSSEFYVCLNNDVEVCEGWLHHMTEKLESGAHQVGILNEGFCNALDPSGLGYYQPHREKCEFVEGSGFMMRLEQIRKQGMLFNPSYRFAYFEDSDLSLTLRSKGFKVDWVELPMIHHRSATVSNTHTVDLHGYFIRNQLVFLQRWGRYIKERTFSKRNVLFIRKVALGDVLCLIPTLRAYHENNNANIDVVTLATEALNGLDFLRNIYEPKNCPDYRLYDEVFDLEFTPERNKNLPIDLAFAKAAGVELKNRALKFPISNDDREFSDAHLSRGPDRVPYIAINVGPQDPEGRDGRVWPLDKFQQVAKILKSEGYRIVELGLDIPSLEIADVDLRDKTTLEEAAAVLSTCDLFIGVDSALGHLAMDQQGLSCLILFGCQDPTRIIKDRKYHHPIYIPLGCAGCLTWSGELRQVKCYRHDVKNLCMESITPELVLNKAREVLLGTTVFANQKTVATLH